MDLKSILPKKKEDNEYFWSVVIEPDWVQAGVWKIEEKKVVVVAKSNPIAWKLDDELISASDAALSSVIQELPEDFTEPQKTVFGVSSSWVDDSQIKEEYLVKIKKICQELSLTPVGFVVVSEAVAHYFKNEEGGPLNTLIIGVSSGNLELALYQNGKLIGTAQVARSVSISDDVAEGLSRFSSKDALPSRFILFNGREGDLEDAKQELIKANWEDYEKIKFLHTPKIEFVSSDEKVMAVSLAGGAEMSEVEGVVEIEAPEKAKVVQTIEEPVASLPPDEEIANITEADDDLHPEDFGFEVNEMAQNKPKPDFSQKTEAAGEQIEEKIHAQPEPPKQMPIPVKKKFNFSGLTKIFSIFNLRNLKFPGIKTEGTKPLLIGFIAIILLIIGGGLFWWFFPKAEVTIYISPKSTEEKFDITIDPAVNSADFEKGIIPGKVVERTLTLNKSKGATGSKTVGDKATGEITIYRVGTELTLSASTLVKGPQGLNFTLNDEVSIASGSAINQGTTKANVAAEKIGADYNLASGQTFSIGNYSTSDMEATNENAFSGGSSREVSAVSEADKTSLLKDLQNELEESLKEEVGKSISDDEIVIDDSYEFTIEEEDYNHKVGDEADTLTLDLTITAKAVAVKNEQIISAARKALEGSVSEGFTLKDDQIEPSFSFKEGEGGVYNVEVFAKAGLLPKIDTDLILENITGRFPDVAREYLTKNVPGFVRAEIVFKNFKFPGKLGSLPRVSKNITIEVSAEK
ncbi:MAG TPA: baseplate J/gp47 family protein [Patescibacteria group bacterium]|nr:baseplate J/gp47 family protein [Patescibacteria group bacterium]